MSWLTGRDTGTKARNDSDRRRVRKCGRCNRPLKSNGDCAVCSVDIAAYSKTAAPRPCPKCGKTMRGGVCPGMWC